MNWMFIANLFLSKNSVSHKEVTNTLREMCVPLWPF